MWWADAAARGRIRDALFAAGDGPVGPVVPTGPTFHVRPYGLIDPRALLAVLMLLYPGGLTVAEGSPPFDRVVPELPPGAVG